MGMTGSGMKASVEAKIAALSNFPQTGQTPQIMDDRVLEAFCEGIVEYIQSAAVVPPGTFKDGHFNEPITGSSTVE